MISAATELTGDVNKAIFGIAMNRLPDYGHRTAAELVADGQVEAVLAGFGARIGGSPRIGL